ncbi:16S rRNA (cytidine(1402)-2'-O)-methyltransferase [Xinfangfangia sp. D13-10-4-6]|uniref:16S rRNA (cytidine(1402)-2'-O)-methyltransferase n=1 Tax=Pseudogemmobacter hezensis TaxID=2737662 RepID=UPI001554FE7A|nr:16S rRNA (cytidine(1402)-2'-O)-methyltransferase [Pseudogemmobacter hezensis]NPD14188.1 16S rRNA (cytidine(1402)-2'-O)-methyltransferase [Pseudogemmobacter hezensis]
MTGNSENSSRWRASAGGIAPGLHLVATPIGAARDITLRALDILAGADVLAAEDTRTLRHLMEIHGVALNGRPLIAVHDHNEKGVAARITGLLREGRSVAYASEAGTPLISDPGFGLARAAVEAGQTVLAAPGASAVLAALAVAGLPTDRFLFAGFPPAAAGERQRFFAELLAVGATAVFYESPRRIRKTLAELAVICGPTRRAAVCRELTKRHEEVLRGSFDELLEAIGDTDPKGEIVLVVDRAPPEQSGPEAIALALDQALLTMRVKEAAAFVAQTLNVARREVYQMALERSRKPD